MGQADRQVQKACTVIAMLHVMTFLTEHPQLSLGHSAEGYLARSDLLYI